MVCTPLKFLKMYKKIQFNMDVVEYFVMDESDKYFELVIFDFLYLYIYILYREC
jgi:superfamily II DNA/RNA helicase